MKNQFSIIMFSLLGLCAMACILLIVVIISTNEKSSDIKTNNSEIKTTDTTKNTDSISVPYEDKILIPDRLKNFNDTIHSTNVIDSNENSTDNPTLSTRSAIQRFFSRYSCRQMISASDLKLLLKENKLFCQKSAWSKEWANPSGKGIRRSKEGLLIQDSTVIDSFTSVIWQRFSTVHSLSFDKTDSVIAYLNLTRWQGYDDWRLPKVEELMATLLPRKNRAGLFLPPGWNSNAQNIWSCNFACDSLSVQWVWVVRTALGRCNVGHPATPRSLLVVRSM